MSKRQGTPWESEVRDGANTFPHLDAKRAENNAPCRDVEIRAGSRTVVIENKNTAALNVHGMLKKTMKANPGEPVRVAWKRLVKKEGSKRRTQAGPAIIAVAWQEYLDELNVIAAAEQVLLRPTESNYTLAALEDALRRMHSRFTPSDHPAAVQQRQDGEIV